MLWTRTNDVHILSALCLCLFNLYNVFSLKCWYLLLYFLHVCCVVFIEDMWPSEDRDEDEPDWVRTEREQFSTFRDKNNDGHMDRNEVMDWIIPADYDHSEAEARHLIFESDNDRVGFPLFHSCRVLWLHVNFLINFSV